ncbi:NAD(P)-dependent dehydrogenase (short-subunit alcohol dehydrogenase family) [Kineosphaera limosa]|uniref:Putative oxidoreductase n=1 Tax=Kineosphaera limosa NBRC 100340 TaxID=1184609 RepID=K6XFD3_9MICO|nr:SDR family NAD(P)-dependent oxidoreductase [Kineosphaera limosa]NYE00471.1 NAD(P)-dependent dehydrogenase (short-subunit alcohol dehydrogenase family) [Kineosphaera limosa]GAB97554.1 putative oxidoreductase [Kineosphaera limosa NBRC 100340]
MTTAKTWLITGASSGLGLALTRYVLTAGHRVVATTRKEALPVEDALLTVVRLDPSDREQCRGVVAEAGRSTGRLDVLVNNAGYGLVGAVEEVSEVEARAIVDVDLFGPMWMTQAALPIMRRQGEGHIVQISSTGGVGAMPFLGLYNAAKWGLEGFSEALAAEVRPMGIRVTLAEIGAMDTQWATSSMRFSTPNNDYDQIREQVLGTATVPWPSEPGASGGGTAPDEIARGIVNHVSAECGPLRLVLGEGAADQIATVFDLRRQDYATQPGFEHTDTDLAR